MDSVSNKSKNIANHIAIDYYFGRADSNEENKIYRKISRKRKYKYGNSNFTPLTPKPLDIKIIKSEMPRKERVKINSLELEFNLDSQKTRDPFEKMFESLLLVLKDSIKHENDKLLKYDWLKTTVNIQAAIRKLMDLTEQLKRGEFIHPKDVELLKYIIYLFKSSKIILKKESEIRDLNKIENYDPERATKIVVKFPKKRIIKQPIRLWMEYAALLLRGERKMNFGSHEDEKLSLLDDFEDFLQALLFNLNDLHDAVKHISLKTDYKNQNWLKDLKAIFFEKGNRKRLGKLILHLGLSRFLDSVENSSSHVERDFRSFVNTNRESVVKSREECLFVLNVLEELSKVK
ncbi:uncharacterized protein LOC128198974 [Bicyclus anynana]|uniref:Uncharacterized protein LOC128198974 n=1 Tax=Bicyclus anynana TaxID=110368 RepID=A0ABM3LVB6_BICAN|nr:uncharacterized protein LOC128198974 [Bicyclus anynana]